MSGDGTKTIAYVIRKLDPPIASANAAEKIAVELAALKHETNELELRLAAANGKRRINIDPGYLSAHSLILATTKQAAHRPYLGRGIYADLTYRFIRGGFEPLEWTYPDFRQPHVRRFFERLRQECLSMAVNKQAASV